MKVRSVFFHIDTLIEIFFKLCRDINPSSLIVRCGDWDITDDSTERFSHQDRNVESISIHPRFDDDRTKLYNDIAILHLKEEFDMKHRNIDTICLPHFDGEDDFDRKDCVTMGWGKDASKKTPYYQNFMKQIKLKLVEHEACQTGLRGTRLRDDFILHDSMICAGGDEGKDACEGDGGGPLICKAKGESERYDQGEYSRGHSRFSGSAPYYTSQSTNRK